MAGNLTKNWVDYLPDLINSYNKIPHRSTGMAPNDVNIANRDTVFRKLYPNRFDKKIGKYNVHDRVRILIDKKLFEKGYKQNGRI